jgi:uncharacterized membrane protein YccF (DUF307 family)
MAGSFMFGGVVETLIYILVAILLIALIVGIARR